jgi:hypothetical protein
MLARCSGLSLVSTQCTKGSEIHLYSLVLHYNKNIKQKESPVIISIRALLAINTIPYVMLQVSSIKPA